MKFIASRLSDGNKIFPPEIHCEEHGLTVKIPGLFKGESQYFDYQQISSVAVETPFIGFSTITFFAGGNFISAHGFTTSEVKAIKRAIDSGKVVRIKTHDLPQNQVNSKIGNSSISSDTTPNNFLYQNTERALIDTRHEIYKKVHKRNSANPDDSDLFEALIERGLSKTNYLITERYGYKASPASSIVKECLKTENHFGEYIRRCYNLSNDQISTIYTGLHNKYFSISVSIFELIKNGERQKAIEHYRSSTNQSPEDAALFIRTVIGLKYSTRIQAMVKRGRQVQAIELINNEIKDRIEAQQLIEECLERGK